MFQSKIYEFIQNKNEINHLLVSNHKEAQDVRDIFDFCDITSFVLPHINIPYGDDLKPFREEIFEVNNTLRNYYAHNGRKVLILTLATSLLHFPAQSLLRYFTINFADNLNLSDFKDMIYRWGYTYSDMVELEGEVSIRGDIIDIFIPCMPHPHRICLFDNEIESIREYELSTNKSKKEEIESITIPPALFSFDEQEHKEISQEIEEFEGNILEKDMESIGYWLIKSSTFFIDEKTFLLHTNTKNELEDLFLDKREKSISDF